MVEIGWVRAALLAGAVGVVSMPVARAGNCGAESTQAGMNDCAFREFKAADAALNAAYRQIMARLSGQTEARQLLTAAQRAWMAFRDAECKFSASGVQGGSIQPMIASMCQTDLTKARTETLRRHLDCKEGDLGCPVPAQ